MRGARKPRNAPARPRVARRQTPRRRGRRRPKSKRFWARARLRSPRFRIRNNRGAARPRHRISPRQKPAAARKPRTRRVVFSPPKPPLARARRSRLRCNPARRNRSHRVPRPKARPKKEAKIRRPRAARQSPLASRRRSRRDGARQTARLRDHAVAAVANRANRNRAR